MDDRSLSDRRTGLKKIKIGQINLQRSYAATVNAEYLVKKHDLDMMCLQEPYVSNNAIGGLPMGFRIIESGEHTIKSGIAVHAADLQFFHPLHHSSGNMVFLEILNLPI
ncbi:Uncharacterised protein r2_g3499 [Pycnogonum litorale]